MVSNVRRAQALQCGLTPAKILAGILSPSIGTACARRVTFAHLADDLQATSECNTHSHHHPASRPPAAQAVRMDRRELCTSEQVSGQSARCSRVGRVCVVIFLVSSSISIVYGTSKCIPSFVFCVACIRVLVGNLMIYGRCYLRGPVSQGESGSLVCYAW